MTQTMLSPWLQWLDSARYQDHLHRIRSLGIEHAASAHTPALHGVQVGKALPDRPAPAWPVQSDLDAVLASLEMSHAA